MIESQKKEQEILSMSHILVIDDDKEFCANLKDILEETGYFVDIACSGNSAIDLSRRKTYDIHIVDIVLGDMSGHEVVEKISDISPATNFIFITGYASLESAIDACNQRNVVSYETKPVNMDHILFTIRQILERKKAQEALLFEKQRLEDVTSNANCGLFLLDGQVRITYANSIAEKWFGPLDQIKGKRCWEVFNLEESEKECAGLHVLKTGKISQSEAFMKKISGEEKFYYEIASPVKDESGRICQINAVVMDITERKKTEEQIRGSLKEKEVLLKEIHHRVKNNMTVITSLLKLQSDNIEDKQIKEVFSHCVHRIKSMALIHEKLYKSADLTRINFHDYFKDMIKEMFMSYGLSSSKVVLTTDVEDFALAVDTAIPCGLIVNELVSNSLKYAFPENRKGEINLSLSRNDKSEVELIVGDNGIGIPEDINFRQTKTLGLSLVNALVKQLRGKIELNKEKGTQFKITFMYE